MAGTTSPSTRAIANPSRRWAWLLALLAPLVLAPLWYMVYSHTTLPGTIGTWSGLVAVLLLTACSVTDIRRHKIHNWATYPAVLWALGLNAAGSIGDGSGEEYKFLGAIGFPNSIVAAVIVFFIALAVYSIAGGGGGDVKLATALGALLGVDRAMSALLYTFIGAGVIIACWAIWTVGPIFLFKAFARRLGAFFFPGWVGPPSAEEKVFLQRPIPLAAFFALGTTPVLLGLDLQW
ncbi:MAG: A24 family peptidase [Gemmataceae bacterium]|nr:A24 family peptidase [Gemmataceae bacterium]